MTQLLTLAADAFSYGFSGRAVPNYGPIRVFISECGAADGTSTTPHFASIADYIRACSIYSVLVTIKVHYLYMPSVNL